jgi:hypothetical protein
MIDGDGACAGWFLLSIRRAIGKLRPFGCRSGQALPLPPFCHALGYLECPRLGLKLMASIRSGASFDSQAMRRQRRVM